MKIRYTVDLPLPKGVKTLSDARGRVRLPIDLPDGAKIDSCITDDDGFAIESCEGCRVILRRPRKSYVDVDGVILCRECWEAA